MPHPFVFDPGSGPPTSLCEARSQSRSVPSAAGRHDLRPVGRERHAPDGADLGAERRRLPPGGRVPKRDAPRAVASRDLLSVRREADREEQRGSCPTLRSSLRWTTSQISTNPSSPAAASWLPSCEKSTSFNEFTAGDVGDPEIAADVPHPDVAVAPGRGEETVVGREVDTVASIAAGWAEQADNPMRAHRPDDGMATVAGTRDKPAVVAPREGDRRAARAAKLADAPQVAHAPNRDAVRRRRRHEEGAVRAGRNRRGRTRRMENRKGRPRRRSPPTSHAISVPSAAPE